MQKTMLISIFKINVLNLVALINITANSLDSHNTNRINCCQPTQQNQIMNISINFRQKSIKMKIFFINVKRGIYCEIHVHIMSSCYENGLNKIWRIFYLSY